MNSKDIIINSQKLQACYISKNDNTSIISNTLIFIDYSIPSFGNIVNIYRDKSSVESIPDLVILNAGIYKHKQVYNDIKERLHTNMKPLYEDIEKKKEDFVKMTEVLKRLERENNTFVSKQRPTDSEIEENKLLKSAIIKQRQDIGSIKTYIKQNNVDSKGEHEVLAKINNCILISYNEVSGYRMDNCVLPILSCCILNKNINKKSLLANLNSFLNSNDAKSKIDSIHELLIMSTGLDSIAPVFSFDRYIYLTNNFYKFHKKNNSPATVVESELDTRKFDEKYMINCKNDFTGVKFYNNLRKLFGYFNLNKKVFIIPPIVLISGVDISQYYKKIDNLLSYNNESFYLYNTPLTVKNYFNNKQLSSLTKDISDIMAFINRSIDSLKTSMDTILLVSGKPNCGKSFLITHIDELLEKENKKRRYYSSIKSFKAGIKPTKKEVDLMKAKGYIKEKDYDTIYDHSFNYTEDTNSLAQNPAMNKNNTSIIMVKCSDSLYLTEAGRDSFFLYLSTIGQYNIIFLNMECDNVLHNCITKYVSFNSPYKHINPNKFQCDGNKSKYNVYSFTNKLYDNADDDGFFNFFIKEFQV
jgi:hypothetical protein